MLLWALLLTACSSSLADFLVDKVTKLPGLSFTPKFDHYSGFLTASPTHYFHYWFTRSQRDPVNDPVILWLNGGPGCSSIGGLLEELGPFRIIDNGNTVAENPFAWNKVANFLFISSPAAVGYSYTIDGNITTSDDAVAADNYNALLFFFAQRFPELRHNDLYITGESYAGVYLPMLGVLIARDKTNFPNFKGMAVGNGLLNSPLSYNTMIPHGYEHALMRQNLFDTITETCCNGNALKCDYFSYLTNPQSQCFQLMYYPLEETLMSMDPYNLYNQCYLDAPVGSKRNQIREFLFRSLKMPLKKYSRKDSTLPLCAQTNNTEIYMNRADVRAALHIPSLLPHWIDCNDDVMAQYGQTHMDMSPEFNELSASGIKILVYNGDVDAVCNAQMNSQFLAALNRTITDNFGFRSKPWHFNRKAISVAGYVTSYSGGIDFVTIRGAGHFVPEDTPKESLQMLVNWINGVDYSTPITI